MFIIPMCPNAIVFHTKNTRISFLMSALDMFNIVKDHCNPETNKLFYNFKQPNTYDNAFRKRNYR